MQGLKNAPIVVKVGLILLVVGTGGYTGLEFLINNKVISFPSTPAESGASEYQDINITVQEKLQPQLIPNVKVEIISDGPPTSKITDSNGYLETKIPKRKTVTLLLSKKGYKNEAYIVDLQADPKTTRTFYLGSNESPTTTDSSMPTVSLSPTTVSSPNNESTPLTRAGTLTGKYVGNWTGNLTQKNSQDNSSQQFRLNIKLKNGNVGSKVGEYTNSGYPCFGVLILRGVKSDSIELFANITGGSCISGTITMKLIGDDLIEYKAVFPDSTITVAGLLTRE